MPYAIFTGLTPVAPYRRRPRRPGLAQKFEGTEAEQRSSLVGRTFWEWFLSYVLTDANAATLDAFFVARGQEQDAFLWKPIKSSEYARTGISLGTSIAAQTVFALPTTGEYAGDYPISVALTTLYSDATPIAIASVQVDARTITADAAPGAGHAMTADYHRYALVRLQGGYEVEEPVYTRNDIRALNLLEVTG